MRHLHPCAVDLQLSQNARAEEQNEEKKKSYLILTFTHTQALLHARVVQVKARWWTEKKPNELTPGVWKLIGLCFVTSHPRNPPTLRGCWFFCSVCVCVLALYVCVVFLTSFSSIYAYYVYSAIRVDFSRPQRRAILINKFIFERNSAGHCGLYRWPEYVGWDLSS